MPGAQQVLSKYPRTKANTSRRGAGLLEGFTPSDSINGVTQNEQTSFYGMRAIFPNLQKGRQDSRMEVTSPTSQCKENALLPDT